MKIKSIKNVDRFLEFIKECSGDIYLITSEGDKLNLKSKLTQYVALANMFDAEASLSEFEIHAEPQDLILIMEYLVRE